MSQGETVEKGQCWDPQLYDSKLSMVARYGDALIEMLDPKAGERILDLGCGTGHHARAIAERGAKVIGIDASERMIAEAKRYAPELDFRVADGSRFALETRVDAVFSNAALHWMHPPRAVVRRMAEALKEEGRLVLEMGAKGNLQHLWAAIERASEALGRARPQSPWFFPSIGEYSSMLEEEGFRVHFARDYERPTPMKDPESGLRDWLRMFWAPFVSGGSDSEPSEAVSLEFFETVEALAREALHREGRWFVDYRRLQIVADRRGDPT